MLASGGRLRRAAARSHLPVKARVCASANIFDITQHSRQSLAETLRAAEYTVKVPCSTKFADSPGLVSRV